MRHATTKIILKVNSKLAWPSGRIGPVWVLTAALGLTAVAVQEQHSAEVLHAYNSAHIKYHEAPQNPTNAWEFARTCFDLGDYATNNTERALIADQGIAAARQAMAAASNAAPAHYYLGLNLGQLARTKTLGALRLVAQMEREFSTAAALDAQFDYAGPDRSLGMLYRDAPSIGSIGNRAKARQHLQRAVQLAPNYPDNQLNLIESYMKWNDRNAARRELIELEAGWKTARATFTGPAWATSWADWETRIQSARKILGEPPKPLETPRH